MDKKIIKDFKYYPEITDPNFNEELYNKKEFRDNEIKKNIHLDFNIKNNINKIKEFELEPHQVFLRTYISPDTPYNGVIVFHGTGVGKTCSAISIAEGFKKTLKNMNKKILILSNPGLEKNFKKEIFNFQKESLKTKKNLQYNVQCTGKTYELGQESLFLTKNQRIKEIQKLIKSYYQFAGYIKFANDIKDRTGGWKGEENLIDENIKEFISREYDDRVIIIDEIQNIKTGKEKELQKTIQPILQAIIKYGKNIKLVMMSATPMFDRPDEIIFYINLFLQNDNRKLINKSDIFNSKDGSLKPDAENILKDVLKGYVSYVRAEKPFIFPFRIYPKNSAVPKIEYYLSGKKLEPKKGINYTRIICNLMKDYQQNTYLKHLNDKIKNGSIRDLNNKEIDNQNEEEYFQNNDSNNDKKKIYHFDLIAISNIIYPIKDKKKKNKILNYGNFGKQCIETDVDNGLGGYYKVVENYGLKKKIVKYRYQSHSIFNKDTANESPFADETNLESFSTKFHSILNSIKSSKGLVFIFSHFIEQGTLPLALILEQNGFDRECVDGESNLLEYAPNKLKKGGKRKNICYLCGKEIKDSIHNNEKLSGYHIFKRAKYILYFGESRDIVKIKKDEVLNKFSSENNIYGEEVKVLIGTKTISEGLDFKRIRQVHIIDPWYNLSRHEQIIGRAIRNYSHVDLPSEERNVEIYQYASILNKKEKLSNRESIDLRNYRMAENKDLIIKKINRIMKESAVDCVLFKKANIIINNKKIKQINSNREVIEVNIGDKPYTSICDYQANCDYKCNWEPNPRKNYPMNNDTYIIRFAYNDIQKCKKVIKDLFKSNIVYDLSTIEHLVLKKYPNMNKLFIYCAIEEIVDNKNEIIINQFSIKGYIIYRGDYYVFQPFDIDRDEIPLIYRNYPMSIKKYKIDIENYDIDYENDLKNNINNLNDYTDKIFINTLKKIDETFNLHKEIYSKNFSKQYFNSVIGNVIDKLNSDKEIIFIKNILTKYLLQEDIKYVKEIIDYYNSNNKLINYYADIYFNKPKINNKIYIGFIINNNYYVSNVINQDKSFKDININNINFVQAKQEIVNKIEQFRNIYISTKNKNNNNFNIIYGKIEKDENKKNKTFKIVDKSSEEEIFTKEKERSKRALITGRACSTYKIGKLYDMRKILNMYKIDGKRKISFICDDIEIYLRYKQYTDGKSKTWFIFDE